MNINNYFAEMRKKVDESYAVANAARARGLDPADKVEIPLAANLAEKCVGLISTIYPQMQEAGISERIVELEKQYGALDMAVSFKIAEEVAHEKFCKFESLLQAIDAGIRVGFAYTTLGVVSSPIEGFTELKLGKTREGKDYFIAYFSGPIRSAGTTASCVALMIIDYLREHFGFAKYDPDEKEVKRYVTENYDYHERVSNLQYLPTEDEIEFLAKNLPIQLSGEPTIERDVSNYKDLPRVETNRIRGGMCLIFSEGLAQKAQKGLRLYKATQAKGFIATGWNFLDDYVALHKKREKGSADASPTYIKDLVAGRPVYGHPSRAGGFRFRYGKSRVNGFSATSIHPATMAISNNFLSTGTQLKVEKPTKGCAVTSCDRIDGPIVKLKDGSVRKLSDAEEAKKLYKDSAEIIYLGDILFSLGDVINRNYELLKPGYCEEWWGLELEKSAKEKGESIEIDAFSVSIDKAIEISKKYGIPLHPRWIYYWNEIDFAHFLALIDWIGHGKIANKCLVLPWQASLRDKFAKAKRALELLGCEHKVVIESVVLSETESRAFLLNIGIDVLCLNLEEEANRIAKKSICADENGMGGNETIKAGSVFEIVNNLCAFKIKDKSGTWIGARMGRPEKAKLRKLTGSPHALFPVGSEGGRLRSVQAAVEVGSVSGEFPIYVCTQCGNETIYTKCEKCGGACRKMKYCPECMSVHNGKCEEHNLGAEFMKKRIDMKHYFESAKKKIGAGAIPEIVKGVRGTSNEDHSCENLAKGLLRARHNLHVNKDGTIRYDGTELPITHFKPCEIGVSIKKLKELGYEKDIYGKELESEGQILEIFPHDVLLPCCPDSPDEKADDVFMNIADFIDEMLKNFYGLDEFYKLKSKEDLVGQLIVCMAPHNCAGVITRIVGFSKVQGILASPYVHAAVRRDCLYPATNFAYVQEGVVRHEPIGDYVERAIASGAKKKIVDKFGTEKVECDKEIYALGVEPKTMKLKKKRIKHFIKGAVPEKWVKIETASGREQIMTSTHKFVYIDEKTNDFAVKKAENIKCGDKIALLKDFTLKSTFFCLDEIDMIKELTARLPESKLRELRLVGGERFLKNFVENKGRENILDVCGKHYKNLHDWYIELPFDDLKKLLDKGILKAGEIPAACKIKTIYNNDCEWGLKLKIDKDLAGILGYYAAEGWSRQNDSVSQVAFRIRDRAQQKKIVEAIKNCLGVCPNISENGTKITICNKMVYYLFKYVFEAGDGAYQKKVPNAVFNLPDAMAKEYLSCFFDGDGTILFQKGDEGHKRAICFYSVSRRLLDGLAFMCSRFGIFGRFSKTKERLPGKKVLERYAYFGKEPKKHILHHLTFSGKDFFNISGILTPVNELKLGRIKKALHLKKKLCGDNGCLKRRVLFNGCFKEMAERGDILTDYVRKADKFEEKTNSYCFEIEWESEEDKNVLWGENILNARCDGDEVAIMMLLDVLINFSRKFLPSHRGGTQDAPLVLNSRINAGEVDDQILDLELGKYPLEMYEAAERGEHSSKVSIDNVKKRLKAGQEPLAGAQFTHDTENFNHSVLNSSYKILPTMKEKVGSQMELCKKLRSVDVNDVSRLVIERHFIRDTKGNLRKFSQQVFRCVNCNAKFRRTPLSGKCTKCGGRLIFTISEGSVLKYMQPALELARTYSASPYLLESLELTEKYIESIFGKEKEKQEALAMWMKK
jgi:DNA polymerase II large subunit